MFALKYEIRMNLIAYDNDIMFHADIANCFKLIKSPHAADRIVRAAQEKEMNIVFYDFFLKIIYIHNIAALVKTHKIIAHRHAAVVLNNFFERIIYR